MFNLVTVIAQARKGLIKWKWGRLAITRYPYTHLMNYRHILLGRVWWRKW